MVFGINKEKIKKRVEEIEDSYERKVNEEFIIDNACGFIGAKGGVGTSNILINTALEVVKKGKTVCIVDFDVFYPSICRGLDVDMPKKGRGLLRLLTGEAPDNRNEFVKTKINDLFVVSRSEDDNFEDFFDFDDKEIKRTINMLKSVFDIVLIDIPNSPPLAFCYSAVANMDKGFIIWDDSIDCLQNTIDLMHFMLNIGINSGKMNRVILNKRTDTPYPYESVKATDCELVSEIPYIRDFQTYVNRGEPYIEYGTTVDKRFIENINVLVSLILNR